VSVGVKIAESNYSAVVGSGEDLGDQISSRRKRGHKAFEARGHFAARHESCRTFDANRQWLERKDGGSMSSQEEVVQALEELISAVAAARAEMRRAQLAMGRALKRIAAGETIESLIVLRPPAEKRKAFLEALEDVHRTRHAARQKVFTYAQQRGLTIAELARAWGISRQLASRYLKEGPPAMPDLGVEAELLSEAPVVERAEVLLEGAAADDGHSHRAVSG
jgi:hypothetical protein